MPTAAMLAGVFGRSCHLPARCPGWFHGIVQDRGELQQAEISVGQRSSEVGVAGHVSHESVDRFAQLHADAVGFSVVAERHCTVRKPLPIQLD